MQSIHQYAWLIPVLPCVTAGILGFGLLSARNIVRSQRWAAASISIGTLMITMFLSIAILFEQINSEVSYNYLWSWVTVGTLSFQIGYLVDSLSSIMLVLVTSVAVTVMVYTHGYMSHDQGYVRFFAYLSLFTASMLGLILSPNLVQVYIFWELVGMCSYLLVGFWFSRPSAAYACQKAFITNRIGDFGLLLGILGFYWLTGSLEFDIISERTHELIVTNSINKNFISICCILLFLGPVAKSAQFPLHVWLPDAMEGPTPISALIHAATMVAAGVFLVARLLPLFQEIPLVMDIIAWTGGVTAVLGATIAVGQKDLKKGLAYSTMSQLGYMILALGIGSYQAGLFHLITHAYSKALLFLGSGSVIHGLEPVVGYNPNKSQNMTYMGGLRQYMPITGITFLVGTLSLCGVPPFACFWSKDEILADAWIKFPLLGWIAWCTAGLTAFYMFRMYFLTFEGNFRGWKQIPSVSETNNQNKSPLVGVLNVSNNNSSDILNKSIDTVKPHESANSMTLPLMILTVPTIFIGFIGAPLPNGIPNSSLLSHWLYFQTLESVEIGLEGWKEFGSTALLSVGIGFIGIILAWIFYNPNTSRLNKIPVESVDPLGTGLAKDLLNAIYKWSLNRAYIDTFYDQTIVRITRNLANTMCLIDQWAIDGLVNIGGILTLLSGEGSRYTGGGRLPAYMFVLIFMFLVFFVLGIVIRTIFGI